MGRRIAVADFWDEVVAHWLRGRETWPAPLDRWIGTYKGRGRGKLIEHQYPDPFAGDLRGEQYSPRLLVLGLNPGIGFDALQARGGLWATEILRNSYSRYLTRRPPDIPERWIQLAGSPSRYWRNLISFAQRWLDDSTATANDILNMELYPWHSNSLTATLASPPDLVREYVLGPLTEFEEANVFAFGKEWLDVAARLDLREIVAVHQPLSLREMDDRQRWRVGVFRLGSDHRLVVSCQSGYAGPPGLERIRILREVLQMN